MCQLFVGSSLKGSTLLYVSYLLALVLKGVLCCVSYLLALVLKGVLCYVSAICWLLS
jgi:hypothetical protein